MMSDDEDRIEFTNIPVEGGPFLGGLVPIKVVTPGELAVMCRRNSGKTSLIDTMLQNGQIVVAEYEEWVDWDCPKCGYRVPDTLYEAAVADFECPRCHQATFSSFRSVRRPAIPLS